MMSLLRIEKFLFLFELEIGGLVLGWLTTLGFASFYCLMAGIAIYFWILGDIIFPPHQTFLEQLYISKFIIFDFKRT